MTNLKPGREMDALVAEKVMGWTHVSTNSGMALGVSPLNPIGAVMPDLVPNYSTSIADAWEVAEILRKMWPKSCSEFHLYAEDDGTYSAVFFDSSEDYEITELIVESPNGPAHAICLAALKAVGAM